MKVLWAVRDVQALVLQQPVVAVYVSDEEDEKAYIVLETEEEASEFGGLVDVLAGAVCEGGLEDAMIRDDLERLLKFRLEGVASTDLVYAARGWIVDPEQLVADEAQWPDEGDGSDGLTEADWREIDNQPPSGRYQAEPGGPVFCY